MNKLENQGGVPGKRLAAFFHKRDSEIKWGALGCIVVPPLAGRIWGIKIVFNPVIPNWIRGQAAAVPPGTIFIDSTRINGATAKLNDVAVFGHEISHLEQGVPKWYSVQAEMLTTILTYRLEDEFGVPHHPAGESIRIGQGTPQNPQAYDPWNDTDLEAFKNDPRWSMPYPLRPVGGDISRNWLNQWGAVPFP